MHAVIDDRRAALLDLCRKYRVKELAVFGSAATDDFDESRSDIDFTVEFEESTPIEHADQYLGLIVALEDLFERRIDLVEMSAARNRFFRAEVERTKHLIYGA